MLFSVTEDYKSLCPCFGACIFPSVSTIHILISQRQYICRRVMARSNFSCILGLLLFSLYILLHTVEANNNNNFIKSKCSTTRYPSLCIQSLSLYANAIQQSPRQLAHTAMTISLSRAQSTKAFLLKVKRSGGMKKKEIQAAIKDCLSEMDDTVYRLSKSFTELKRCASAKGGEDFKWHISNVETWVSAALTDDNTCMDGFAGRGRLDAKTRASIKSRIDNVAQVTSNALALINQYAGNHKP